jgi:isopentenyldiphosphate isomerase
MTVLMTEEIFDVVNERDEVIGHAPRKEVHASGLWHRAVHVLVFNARGDVFLQKRSMLKDTAKGKWDSSSSGHLDTGEDYDACAMRELREEIGLTLKQPPRRLFKVNACKETGWEFCWVYLCEHEGPFTLQPEEIETGAWFDPAALTRWVAEKPGDFASAFVLIWKKFQAPARNTV